MQNDFGIRAKSSHEQTNELTISNSNLSTTNNTQINAMHSATTAIMLLLGSFMSSAHSHGYLLSPRYVRKTATNIPNLSYYSRYIVRTMHIVVLVVVLYAQFTIMTNIDDPQLFINCLTTDLVTSSRGKMEYGPEQPKVTTQRKIVPTVLTSVAHWLDVV